MTGETMPNQDTINTPEQYVKVELVDRDTVLFWHKIYVYAGSQASSLLDWQTRESLDEALREMREKAGEKEPEEPELERAKRWAVIGHRLGELIGEAMEMGAPDGHGASLMLCGFKNALEDRVSLEASELLRQVEGWTVADILDVRSKL
jgi:hypothetical protein